MTFYLKEVHRISGICYSNQKQIDTVIGTRQYINRHFEQKLNLDVLAKVQLTSKYHLLRLFKRYYGQTPKQYLIATRIEKAKALLMEGQTVSATCFAVGFESLGSFSVLFKNKVGQAPSEFQKAQLSRSSSKIVFRTCPFHYAKPKL